MPVRSFVKLIPLCVLSKRIETRFCYKQVRSFSLDPWTKLNFDFMKKKTRKLMLALRWRHAKRSFMENNLLTDPELWQKQLPLQISMLLDLSLDWIPHSGSRRCQRGGGYAMPAAVHHRSLLHGVRSSLCQMSILWTEGNPHSLGRKWQLILPWLWLWSLAEHLLWEDLK